MSQRLNNFQYNSRSAIISRSCTTNKARIIKEEDDWIYNDDNLQMQLRDGKTFKIEKFRISYGQFDEIGSGNGIIYQTHFDQSWNRQFCIEEGKFINYQLQPGGIQYQGKSKIPQHKQNKQNNYCKMTEISNTNNCFKFINVKKSSKTHEEVKEKVYLNQFDPKTVAQSITSKNKKQSNPYIEITQEKDKLIEQINTFISNSLSLIQQELATQVLIFLQKINTQIRELFETLQSPPQTESTTWTKYDQVFSKKDLNILSDNSKEWLNSSILDAYAMYLNKQNEEAFWKSKNKATFRRTIIVPSFITTIFFSNKNYSVRDYFLEYEGIDYKIWKVYRDICFMINIKNFHWVFARVDMEVMQIYLYDSLYTGDQYQSLIKSTLIQLLNSLYQEPQIKQLQIKYARTDFKQTNGYECGICTCIIAKWISEDRMSKEGLSSTLEMRAILRQIIQPP